MLAQPHRRRRRAARGDRQSQLRQSREARDHGPARQGASRASARPARRSPSRSSPATSRSTTRPTAEAILPTPTIGGVGLIEDRTADGDDRRHERRRRALPRRRATAPISARRSICARSRAARTARRRPSIWPTRSATAISCAASSAPARVKACHDISDGGLAVDAGRNVHGLRTRAPSVATGSTARAMPCLFGEDQARYVVGGRRRRRRLPSKRRPRPPASPLRRLGTAGGDRLVDRRRRSASPSPISPIAHESWFPDYMSGTLAEAAE